MWYVIQKFLHVLPSLTNLKKLVGAYPLANSRREPNILGLTMNWGRSSGMSHLAQLIAQSQQRLSIVLPPARGRGQEEPLLQCNPGFWRQVIISNQQSGTSNFEDDPASWQSFKSLALTMPMGIFPIDAPITPTTAGARMERRETKNFMVLSLDLDVEICGALC